MMDCLPHIHVAAIHAESGFSSATPGLGILCKQTDTLLGAGVYSNSIGNLSKYAFAGWRPLQIDAIKLGVIVGVVDGYRMNNGGAAPMAALVASYKHINLTLIPGTPKNVAALALSFTF
jgi:hypothetical protein